jgi:hypothetical protein
MVTMFANYAWMNYLSFWRWLSPPPKWTTLLLCRVGYKRYMERLNLERLDLSTTLLVPSQCICQVFGQPKRLVLIPLEGLVVSLVFRFWGHNGAYERNHFLEQRRRVTMTWTLV